MSKPGKPANRIHVIRFKNNTTKEVRNYIRSKAIKYMCAECMGWEENPRNCTSKLCPLFPFKQGRVI